MKIWRHILYREIKRHFCSAAERDNFEMDLCSEIHTASNSKWLMLSLTNLEHKVTFNDILELKLLISYLIRTYPTFWNCNLGRRTSFSAEEAQIYAVGLKCYALYHYLIMIKKKIFKIFRTHSYVSNVHVYNCMCFTRLFPQILMRNS